MLIPAVVLVVLIAFFIIVIIKTVSRVIQFFAGFFLLLVLLSATFGYLTYQDAENIKENISKPNLFAITDGPEVLAAASLQEGNMTALSQKEVTKLNKKQYSDYLIDHFKIVFIDVKAFEELLPDKIKVLEEYDVDKEEFIELMKAEDPLNNKGLELFKGSEIKALDLGEEKLSGFNIKDKSNQRLLLASIALSQIKDTDPLVLFEQYKKGNIRVYRETITFKLAKKLPASFIQGILKGG